MLFSLNYLKKISNLSSKINDEEIIAAFNNLGFEVEKVIQMPRVAKLQFGKVLKTYKNPHGNKLTVCEIMFSDKTRLIQTTAQNVVHGKIVLACVDGSQIENHVFTSKILQKIVSEGMLTSATELGLSGKLLFGDDEGISFYDEISDLNINPIDYLGLNDTIIDLAILPNRPDANSYLIMAHELAAYFHSNLQTLVDKTLRKDKQTSLVIKDLANNVLAAIETANLYKLSFFEKTLIVKSGLQVSDDINDLASLTFLMTGQVIHTLDRDKIGNKLQITKILQQKMIAINQQQIRLDQNNLVISDEKNIIALAGIDVVKQFGANNLSKNVVFIFGQFEHSSVQKNISSVNYVNSKIMQMSKLSNHALIHFANTFLLSKLNDDYVCHNLPILTKKTPIIYDNKTINQWAGFDLTKTSLFSQTLASLKILGFAITPKTITPPWYRHDVILMQDIIEEIFRFYNYNNFTLVAPAFSNFKVSELNDYDALLVAQGFNEVITYFLTSATANQFNPFGFKNQLDLLHPISNLRAQLRNSIVISLQEIAEYHFKNKINTFDFFEISQIHDGKKVLGLCSTSRNFNEFKRVLLNIFGDVLVFKHEKNAFLHPNFSANIYYQNQHIGYIGKLNPHLFNYDVLFCELMLDKILLNVSRTIFKMQAYEALPLKVRDITIDLQSHFSIAHTVNQIKQIDGIFDVAIIDKFVQKAITKVTLRISGNEQAIKELDKNFNE